MSDTPCGGTQVAPVMAVPRRNRYFYGKLLDAPHLQLEQRYGNDKRWLLNRLNLGGGVACGLDVVLTVDAMRVVVRPGMAVDFWGREVLVPADSPAVDVRQPTDPCGRPVGDPVAAGEVIVLWLAYHECESEPVPVLVGDCDTERGCANGVIREQYALIVQRDSELAPAPSCGFPDMTDGASVHALLVDRERAGCADPPALPWIPLARVTAPAEGSRIDPAGIDVAVRPILATNQVLLELVLCLADRVEACCGQIRPHERRLEKEAGDGQTGAPGGVLNDKIVARVLDEHNAPVAGESVVFTAAAGGGAVASIDDPATMRDTVTVATDADGRAAVVWKLGPQEGANALTAAISSGAAVTFSATAREVDLPLLLVMWPPNATVLNVDSDRHWLAKWHDPPHIELTFSREMDYQHLHDPGGWLRMWGLRFDGDVAISRRLLLEFMGPLEPVITQPAGFTVGYRLDQQQASEFGSFLVLLRAEGDSIVDVSHPPLLLDVDFHGTNLSLEVLTQIWDHDAGDIPGARPAFVDTGARLPANDGSPGRMYDGWFRDETRR